METLIFGSIAYLGYKVVALLNKVDELTNTNLQYEEKLTHYANVENAENERYAMQVIDIVEANETPKDNLVLARVAWHRKKLQEVGNTGVEVHYIVFQDGNIDETWEQYTQRVTKERKQIQMNCINKLREADPKRYYKYLGQNVGN